MRVIAEAARARAMMLGYRLPQFVSSQWLVLSESSVDSTTKPPIKGVGGGGLGDGGGKGGEGLGGEGGSGLGGLGLGLGGEGDGGFGDLGLGMGLGIGLGVGLGLGLIILGGVKDGWPRGGDGGTAVFVD